MNRSFGKGQRSWVKHVVSGGRRGFCAVQCADGSQSSGEYLITDICLRLPCFVHRRNFNVYFNMCTYSILT